MIANPTITPSPAQCHHGHCRTDGLPDQQPDHQQREKDVDRLVADGRGREQQRKADGRKYGRHARDRDAAERFRRAVEQKAGAGANDRLHRADGEVTVARNAIDDADEIHVAEEQQGEAIRERCPHAAAARDVPRELVVDRTVRPGFEVARIAHDAAQVQEPQAERDEEQQNEEQALVARPAAQRPRYGGVVVSQAPASPAMMPAAAARLSIRATATARTRAAKTAGNSNTAIGADVFTWLGTTRMAHPVATARTATVNRREYIR